MEPQDLEEQQDQEEQPTRRDDLDTQECLELIQLDQNILEQ